MSEAELERVWNMVDQQRFTEAEHGAKGVLADSPEHPWALRLLSIALRGQSRLEEALLAGEASCRSQPDEPRNWMNLSLVHEERGEIAAAVTAAQRGVDCRPLYASAHARLAGANTSRTDPDDGDSLFDPAAGLRAADQAIRLDPTLARFHTTRGRALAGLGRHYEAARAYRRALELNPSSPAALNNLAWLSVRRRPIGAARLLTRSIHLNPQSHNARENLSLAIQAWMIRMIWILMSGGLVLVLLRWLMPVLLVPALALLLISCITGSEMLRRALPRRSFTTLWRIYPVKCSATALRVFAVLVVDVVLALAHGPLWGLAVVGLGGQVVVEWRADFFGNDRPLRVWDRRSRRPKRDGEHVPGRSF